MPNNTRKYELMVAVRGTLNESESKAVYDALIAELNDKGAKISYEESWGKIDLAYKIKHETAAHYYVINFDYDVAGITALELYLELDRNVIRSLVSKITAKDYTPFTREMYNEGMDEYAQGRQDRKQKSMPKTRATTAAQLEKEMTKIKKKDEPTSAEKMEKIIDKELSL